MIQSDSELTKRKKFSPCTEEECMYEKREMDKISIQISVKGLFKTN